MNSFQKAAEELLGNISERTRNFQATICDYATTVTSKSFVKELIKGSADVTTAWTHILLLPT